MMSIDCTIIGDSIAVGVGAFAPRCHVMAQVGISSPAFIQKYGSTFTTSEILVISLGSNDGAEGITKASLLLLRKGIKAKYVWWILPQHNHEVVVAVAAQYGDLTLAPSKVSKDGVHPTVDAYKEMAHKIAP
jgi:lysophospholipase L1-like esterase